MQIVKRQSTFWDFKSEEGVIRVHFKGKQEYYFISPDVSGFEIVQKHPVLMDYECAWQQVFIASYSVQVKSLFEKIRSAITVGVDGWRTPEHYLNDQYDVVKILQGGQGHLLSGPEPLVKRVSNMLTKEKIEFSALEGRKARWPMEALIAGQNFVVAKSFRTETVPPNKAVQPT